ncbi:hypothetical protein [Microcoleus sp. PH2017_27_LUM_O_A]|uniref:hypothetical protein n=1 Tax=Microcoleus sp. PH2017_27_LUM_O_A TaxID=2798837 RepID=UPI0025DA38BD|nr:hypothetical protein [Microcoleus sp. PH2017_27_LUM_O_A]
MPKESFFYTLEGRVSPSVTVNRRRKKEEGRGKREEGRGKREEGRRKKDEKQFSN